MWSGLIGFLVVGYLAMSRGFAYLGIPHWSLFIGEVSLAAFVCVQPRKIFAYWRSATLERTPFYEVAWSLALFMGYGLLEVVHGRSQGFPLLVALKDLTFNYYPLYLFLGLWVGLANPNYLPKLLRGVMWGVGLYGLAYVLWLSRVDWRFPGTGALIVPVFGQPMGAFVAILGIIAFESSWLRWPSLFLNAFVWLGMQIRGEWIALVGGLLLWSYLSKGWRKVATAFLVVAMLPVTMMVVSFSIPSPATRVGTISFGNIAARVVAPVAPNLARRLLTKTEAPHAANQAPTPAPDAKPSTAPEAQQTSVTAEKQPPAPEMNQDQAKLAQDAVIFADTAFWRTRWWKAIWLSVHHEPLTALFGHGYGFTLTSVVPTMEQGIRTPHNFFFFALGYSGWLGVVLFALFQGALFRLLWRAYRLTGQAFGLSYWAANLMLAVFEPYFETPFGAIPFYLICGLAAAPALAAVGGGHAHSDAA